jgi:hypothetical protein
MSNKKDNTDREVTKTTMVGHVLIRDKDTKEIIVNQRDNLHQQKKLGKDDGR